MKIGCFGVYGSERGRVWFGWCYVLRCVVMCMVHVLMLRAIGLYLVDGWIAGWCLRRCGCGLVVAGCRECVDCVVLYGC